MGGKLTEGKLVLLPSLTVTAGLCPELPAGVRHQGGVLPLLHRGEQHIEGRRLGPGTAPPAPLKSLPLPSSRPPRQLEGQPGVAGRQRVLADPQPPPSLSPPLELQLLPSLLPALPWLGPVGWEGPEATEVERLSLPLVQHLPSPPVLVAGHHLVEAGIEVAAGGGAGLPAEMLPAVLEGLHVPAASLLPPVRDPHSCPLALPGIGSQDLGQ